MSSAAPQTNGVPSSSPPGSNSQLANNTQSQTSQPASNPQTQSTQPATNGVASNSQTSQSQAQPSAVANNQSAAPNSPTNTAPKPRDQRTVELLLNAQGVTAFESRVPLLLLDFAYRHTASVLADSLYLGADPYTTHAGSKPSASAGATASVPGTGGDATVSANAVRLAIGSRLSYQFHGGGGVGNGGISKDAMANMAAERNKIALPRVPPNEWGIRLPSERFVMTGMGWGIKEVLSRAEDDSEDDDDDQEMVDAMEVQPNDEDVGGDGVEGGTLEDVFGTGNTEQVGEEDVDMGGAN